MIESYFFINCRYLVSKNFFGPYRQSLTEYLFALPSHGEAEGIVPLSAFPFIFEQEAGQVRPAGDFQEGVGLAVPGRGEGDGGEAGPRQVEAGFQASSTKYSMAWVRRQRSLASGSPVAMTQILSGKRR